MTKSLLETYYSHASVGATSGYDDPDCDGECCSGQIGAPFQPDIDYSTVKKTQGNKAVSFKRNGVLTSNGSHFVQYVMWCFATIAVP